MTVQSKSYTLRTDNGGWLGQVVLTQDGMFAAVTDWGIYLINGQAQAPRISENLS
jgi:hypothetical protein